MRISVVLILCVEQETRVHEGAGVNWEAISDIDSAKRREPKRETKKSQIIFVIAAATTPAVSALNRVSPNDTASK